MTTLLLSMFLISGGTRSLYDSWSSRCIYGGRPELREAKKVRRFNFVEICKLQVRVGCLAEWLRSGYEMLTAWSGLHFARGLASRDLMLQSLHTMVG